MRFIYATDLHGDQKKYNSIISYAIKNKINLIHLGGDILSKGVHLVEIQEEFIKGFLKKFYKKAKKNNIKILAFFGNDDIYYLSKYFKEYGNLLNENPEEIEGILFKAYSYVCDHPFQLKTASKLDYRGWRRPCCDIGITFANENIKCFFDIDYYLEKKSTIEEDLNKEIITSSNVVMAMHMPPYNLGLDVCGRLLPSKEYDKLRYVGSRSIYNWIKQQQPLLSLHGHIHESYAISKVWKTYLDKTLVVQPGQEFTNIYVKKAKTRFVVFDIEPGKINSSVLIEI